MAVCIRITQTPNECENEENKLYRLNLILLCICTYLGMYVYVVIPTQEFYCASSSIPRTGL